MQKTKTEKPHQKTLHVFAPPTHFPPTSVSTRLPRTTQKPENADPYLKNLVKTLFTDSQSICQRIQHSLVWREELKRYIQAMENRIGKAYHVGAAKHRHESSAKPRRRFLLYFDAFLMVGQHMFTDRDGEVRRDAVRFLDFINTEVLLATAMLADASDEGLYFVRMLDDEETDTAGLQFAASRFIAKLNLLFKERRCLDLPGFTKFMVDQLKNPRLVRLPSNAMKTIGGPQEPSDDVVNRCLQRMATYVRLAIDVTKAEFPNFELCTSFRIFNLEDRRIEVSHCAPAAVSCCAPGVEVGGDLDENFKRLAMFFHVDLGAFVAQFRAHLPAALQKFRDARCSNAEAWHHSVFENTRWKYTLENHPASELVTILLRYSTFAVSTARVEQHFSQVKRVLGERGGTNSTDDTENMRVSLLLGRSPSTADNNTILNRAQDLPPFFCMIGCRVIIMEPRLHDYHPTLCKDLYLQYFKTERYFKNGQPSSRNDSGKPKQSPAEPNSEAAFVKRRRASIDAAFATKRDNEAVEVVEEAELCPKQEELVVKQIAKFNVRQKRAFLEGVLLPEEKTDELARQAAEEVKKRKQRETERKAKNRRMKAITGKKHFPKLNNLSFIECGGVQLSDAVRGALAQQGCVRAQNRLGANMFIADDVTDIGSKATWCASLNGALIVTPRSILDKRGPVLKYFPAKHPHRTVFFSNGFRVKHGKIVDLLEKTSQWKICDTLEDPPGSAAAACRLVSSSIMWPICLCPFHVFFGHV